MLRGGVCLAYIQNNYINKILTSFEDKDQRAGTAILMKSLSKPYMQVAEKVGIEGTWY